MLSETYGGNPFAPAPGSLDLLAEWVETLHGHGDVKSSLVHLAQTVRADSASLLRQVEGRISLKIIASTIDQKDQYSGSRPSSYLREMLGEHLHVMRVGSVISLKEAERNGMMDRDALITLHTRMSSSKTRDVVAIRLSGEAETSDYLELHFTTEVAEADRNLLTILAPTLAKTWQSRLPGTAQKNAGSNNVHAFGQEQQFRVLDAANPLGLTRCEYRVCVLVQEGMLVKSIANKLNVREPTVRSHLRSIFLKTGTSCHVELLHRLSTERVSETTMDQMTTHGAPLQRVS